MARDNPFAGIEQGDVAFLQFEGIAYRCFTWQRNVQRTVIEATNPYGATVEAAIFVEQKHGGATLLWRGVVRTPLTGDQVDCPRVVAFGSSFHLHWIEFDPEEDSGGFASGRTLRRATFEVGASPHVWVDRLQIPTSYLQLFDVQSLGPDGDYILVHATDVDEVTMYRVDGDDWIDAAWVSAQTVAGLSENVLAASANRDAPMAVYAVGDRLAAFSLNWADGTTRQPSTFIATLPTLADELTAVGVCQRGDVDSSDVFVVAEFEDIVRTFDAVDISVPSTLHTDVDAASLAIGPATVTPNTTLQSKPWRYVSSQSLLVQTPQMFAVLGHQATQLDKEWLQSNHYVSRYEEQSSPAAGRPMLAANLAAGIADARPHGAVPLHSPAPTSIGTTGSQPNKRRNHLPSAGPAPSFGPLVKSYTTVLGRWSRLDTLRVVSTDPGGVALGVAVAGAALECTRFHHDNAWAYPYDDSDPDLPDLPYASVGAPQMEAVAVGDGLFLSGGTPQTYDGHRFVEANFPWYPEIVDIREGAFVGGPDPGTYKYVLLYEWRDARGRVHRSFPSEPVEVDASGNRQVLELRCCNLSMKDNEALGASGNPIKLDVYRTLDGGDIYYPLYRGNDGFGLDTVDVPLNDPTALTVQIEDAAPDDSIRFSVPLEFTRISGAWSPLPAEVIPAMGAVATWQNRVFGVSAEDPKRLWISREVSAEARGEEYSVPEFSDALTFRIDEVVGRVVAMQDMDSALILFTRDAIYALHGAPADATGQGSSLQIQLLQRDTGCVEPRSVAPAPDGIYFQSRRGLYKLTRQNSLEFVGADVEDELRAAGNVRAVTVHEDSHQVRVLCNGAPYDSPQVLVYDWLMKLWAVWPLPRASTTPGLSSAVDAVVWRGFAGEHTHVVLQAGGVFVQKPSTSPTRFADEAAGSDVVAIPVDVRTGWIHLAGLAGFKRVRKLGLHFTKPAEAGLTVEIEYDRDGTQTDGADLQTEVFPSPAPAYLEVRTCIQKCTSIRIRIYEGTETPTGEQLTASTLNLHAITMSVGRKPGLGRVSPTQQRT